HVGSLAPPDRPAPTSVLGTDRRLHVLGCDPHKRWPGWGSNRPTTATRPRLVTRLHRPVFDRRVSGHDGRPGGMPPHPPDGTSIPTTAWDGQPMSQATCRRPSPGLRT